MTKKNRSGCPIASGLEIVGDRWTLVILRDMMTDKSKFADFIDSPEKITTNILASRLSQMEENGLAIKREYQTNPTRYSYHLTPKGADLLPLVQSLTRWSNVHLTHTWTPPAYFMEMTPQQAANAGANHQPDRGA
jgi:DNA-binding HxlR family transcriptional regulator